MDENAVLKQIINTGILKDEIKKVFNELYAPYIKGKIWYTTAEAATYLNIKSGTLDNYCWQGKINFSKRGKNREFNIEDLDSYRENSRK